MHHQNRRGSEGRGARLLALDLKGHALVRITMVEGEVWVRAGWDGGGGDAKEEGVCGPSDLVCRKP